MFKKNDNALGQHKEV